MKDIRREIADKRELRIASLGHEEGFVIPEKRLHPLSSFTQDKMLICEVKRSSPSKGKIDEIPSASVQAQMYQKNGAAHVSVLTEPDYFSGSLNDLMEVKAACPDLAVLRKDFLLSVKDINISYRAGADACLLIASLLEQDLLIAMHMRCEELGMAALVELHSMDDVIKTKDFKPGLVGINCRNLKNFRIYPLQPLKIRSLIDWDCRVVYESGILKKEDGAFALNAGFSGLLVGEGVVKNPGLISELKNILTHESTTVSKDPWTKLCSRWRAEKPLVKICGLTNREDFEQAVTLGADLCGFILADSPRQTTPDFIRSLPESEALKVGVVVLAENENLPGEITSLVKDGYLDLIQYHGKESSETVAVIEGYKALRIRCEDDLDKMTEYYPRPSLIDAFSAHQAGGTGKQISPELVQKAKEKGELWLAGGLNPRNIRKVLEDFEPDLVDLSSGLEASPGKKDPVKVKAFFKEIESYAAI
ncbi:MULTISPECIES: bifunctional indole-3-glycerol phosphate synthase/phosphoribosylanthranilate isomerase [unclassified Oceanispirochaeta]|uniref:bifunctional indole-3-glycerol phosphate synthase/phosphoribosylanthranilate isomerase n=1 Tax=unclassified Oceanispirochaeta TaxID=2635722 RepID=UPI000E09B5F9|nr:MULTISPECIES: bifunctional indole-3-glycerol phosphate synthase/phosphoribosylanthranilate isomerase [unclassified Oceanispirochaeta]MBF9014707.1 bifunctional indole-3-glycerol phosphate synthase/phosphoribosylanthranilate isomerase [Oceanispirochaeta sp. M2]NPD70963.1 bifunctional indole-3-glycerol phosphate synthase/phosphoribosylanthranilate isomerase [Oceanispirochaeta sp. M1]RDG33796.1 bifunctional indole-3-glycerol phosphate synthase/phosphoribosylanthranilate isomerase [Oceanispirochae